MSDKKIYFQDGTSFRFEELVQINDKLDISSFLYGGCHIFALALIEHFGDKAQGFCRLIHDYERPHLAHAYVKINNKFVDARGVVDASEIDDYTIDCFEYEELQITKEDISENCLSSSWGAIKYNALEDAKAFIKKYEDIYLGKIDYNTFMKIEHEFDENDREMILKHPEMLVS